VVSLAGGELKQAGETLDKANRASDKREDTAVVDRLAYLADQQVALAQETARRRDAELTAANANTERERARLDARTQEAGNAQRNAESAQRQSENSQRLAQNAQVQSEAAQRNAEASQRQSEASQRQSEISQRQSDAQRQAATEAQFNAEAVRLQSQGAQVRAEELEARLKDLEARKTSRGMVITLGDVLFDTNRSQLRSVGMHDARKVADFLRQYPERRVLIEGYTDSSGTDGRNQELSEQRATSVRTALLDMGVASERIASHGFGESYPVAGNDTAAGRQLNRRVEIIVSDDSGRIAPR
jgi:outer membrane protein OmpA-like peptidoglycan-associated protein